MKIAFYAYYESFDYYKIGGTDSFIRRLVGELISLNKNISVEYVLYGSKTRQISINNNLNLNYISSFSEALQYLDNNQYDHIITTWLLLKDRKVFNKFVKNFQKNTTFHNILFFYPDTIPKKITKFYELTFYKINGKNFIVSNRQEKLYNLYTKNLTLMYPPVPSSYFMPNKISKNENKKLRLTFLGRIDPRKGINEVIELYKNLSKLDKYEMKIYGIYIQEDEEALKIRNWLKQQTMIEYIEVEREKYTPEVDKKVIERLSDTDIFIQPYKDLDSTVDTPLLIAEAIACNCVVLTTNIPPVQDITGKSEFILEYDNFIENASNLLSNLTNEQFVLERERLSIIKHELIQKFSAKNVAKRFIDEL